MTLKFEEWLVTQQQRPDLIGRLARTPSLQVMIAPNSRRRPDEHKSWADLVIRIADPGSITVFNEAWQEFLVARKTAEDNAD